jgi:hypothetical protein
MGQLPPRGPMPNAEKPKGHACQCSPPSCCTRADQSVALGWMMSATFRFAGAWAGFSSRTRRSGAPGRDAPGAGPNSLHAPASTSDRRLTSLPRQDAGHACPAESEIPAARQPSHAGAAHDDRSDQRTGAASSCSERIDFAG